MTETESASLSVSVAELESIQSALHAAYMQSQARDIYDQYQKLSNRQQWSALTKHLEAALDTVDALLEEIADGEG